MFQKLAVLHCVYQLIASADGSIDEARDEAAIDLALTELGLNSVYSWDSALKLNPHDCFIHLAELKEADKQIFRALLFNVVELGGNRAFRVTCANHIIQLCFVE